jgi:pyruvate/2-oxoacid:ferredoxin oxidoreductase beta subunit
MRPSNCHEVDNESPKGTNNCYAGYWLYGSGLNHISHTLLGAVPWLHTAFENAAANASGIETAIKVLRKKGRIKYEHVDVIAIAGDGGTYDIGIQALSGAVERGHDFLFVLIR